MKNKKSNLDNILIYKGQRYCIISVDENKLYPTYEVKDINDEIEKEIKVQIIINVQAVRMNKERIRILPKFSK